MIQKAFITFGQQQDNFIDELSEKAFLYKTIRNSCLNEFCHRNLLIS